MSAATEVVKQMMPLALLFHHRNGMLANQHRAEQVHVDQRMKVFQRQVGDFLVTQDSGVGMHGIQPAKAAHGLLDRGPNVGLLADVAMLEAANVSLGG